MHHPADKLSSLVLAVLTLAACSTQQKSATTDVVGVIQLNSTSVYSVFQNAKPEQVTQLVQKVGALSFQEFYEARAASITNERVEIDGHVFANSLQTWKTNRSSIIALGQYYANVSDMWTDLGVNLKAFSLADYQTSLSSESVEPNVSLALGVVVPVRSATCLQFSRRISSATLDTLVGQLTQDADLHGSLNAIPDSEIYSQLLTRFNAANRTTFRTNCFNYLNDSDMFRAGSSGSDVSTADTDGGSEAPDMSRTSLDSASGGYGHRPGVNQTSVNPYANFVNFRSSSQDLSDDE